MNGREVFRFAVTKMIETTRAALAEANLTPADVTCDDPAPSQPPHHRRGREAASRCWRERIIITVDRYGNTSVRLDPDRALGDDRTPANSRDGDLIVFVGFGGGLSWGAVAWRWSEPECASASSFPGQGSQAVGMGVERAPKAIRRRPSSFAEPKAILGYDLLALCAEGARREAARDALQPTGDLRDQLALAAAVGRRAAAGRQRRAFVRRILQPHDGRRADVRDGAGAGAAARARDASGGANVRAARWPPCSGSTRPPCAAPRPRSRRGAGRVQLANFNAARSDRHQRRRGRGARGGRTGAGGRRQARRPAQRQRGVALRADGAGAGASSLKHVERRADRTAALSRHLERRREAVHATSSSIKSEPDPLGDRRSALARRPRALLPRSARADRRVRREAGARADDEARAEARPRRCTSATPRGLERLRARLARPPPRDGRAGGGAGNRREPRASAARSRSIWPGRVPIVALLGRDAASLAATAGAARAARPRRAGLDTLADVTRSSRRRRRPSRPRSTEFGRVDVAVANAGQARTA